MGILREDPEELRPIRIEDNLENYLLEDSAGESDYDAEVLNTSQSAPPTPRRRRAERRKCGRAGLEASACGGGGGRRLPGRRRARRLEHARLLAGLVEDEVVEDLSDLLPDTETPLARLFTEDNAREKWNAFLAATEEEQEAILAGKPLSDASTDKGHKLGGTGVGRMDGRQAHPAFAPEARFARLDAHLRSVLAHQHTPHGMLDWLEGELVEFFGMEPGGVWLEHLDSSYERLLTHAISQWLGLKSLSLELSPGGRRETQVENPMAFFVPPSETLSAFLLRRRTTPA